MRSNHQTHFLHAMTMLHSRGHDVDACGFDAAVPEDIGELGDILFDVIKRACKEMAQVVRKHLFRVNLRAFAQRFHIPPNVGAAQWLSACRNKDRSRGDSTGLCIS